MSIQPYNVRADVEALNAELAKWAGSGITNELNPDRDAVTIIDNADVFAGKLCRIARAALIGLREAEEERAERFAALERRLAEGLEGLKQKNANQGRLFG
jgi:hypothetical protein